MEGNYAKVRAVVTLGEMEGDYGQERTERNVGVSRMLARFCFLMSMVVTCVSPISSLLVKLCIMYHVLQNNKSNKKLQKKI